MTGDQALGIDPGPHRTRPSQALNEQLGLRKEAQAIVDSQLGRAGRLALADDVIQNEGSLLRLNSKVRKLHRSYIEMAIA
jgi:dephospho-CoA kinase